MADGDFDEEDIWSYVEYEQDSRSSPQNSKKLKNKSISFSSSSSKNSSSPKTIPKSINTNTNKTTRQSAPMNIPDWSKIYQQKNYNQCADVEDDDVAEDGSGERVPPHEWLAKKMARNNISSFSVCEGAGRTLKGRDLSRVRHAVLSKTGFLE
ncbi:hypothetical protein LUZ60_005480 [Juncus effusus]|nr:hypothetical protein LUZ60_005480 [Juncus effusus]